MKVEIELQPFRVPNFVLQKMKPRSREEGFQECPKYSIEELHPDALAELCDQFRKDVFEKAGCKDPGDSRESVLRLFR